MYGSGERARMVRFSPILTRNFDRIVHRYRSSKARRIKKDGESKKRYRDSNEQQDSENKFEN